MQKHRMLILHNSNRGKDVKGRKLIIKISPLISITLKYNLATLML